ADDKDVEDDRHDHRDDDEFADVARRDLVLVGRLGDDVEADEKERDDGHDADEARGATGEQRLSVVEVAADESAGEQEQADDEEEGDDESLHEGGEAHAANVDEGDDDRRDRADQSPRAIDVGVSDGPEFDLLELGEQVESGLRRADGFEHDDADVAAGDRP